MLLVKSIFLSALGDPASGCSCEAVKEETDRRSWAGQWTLSSKPSIYGNNTPTEKPDPRMEEPQGLHLDSPSPRRIP